MSFREFMEMRFKLELPILKLEELIDRHEKIAPDLTATLASAGTKPLAAFRDYLQFGVYPYYFEYEDRELFRATLEQNLHTAIESDLPAVHPHTRSVANRAPSSRLTISKPASEPGYPCGSSDFCTEPRYEWRLPHKDQNRARMTCRSGSACFRKPMVPSGLARRAEAHS
jgi:hypothetical protein